MQINPNSYPRGNSYKDYYRDHYKAGFSARDINSYVNWFGPQWRLIKTEIGFSESNGTSILEIGSGLGGLYKLLQNDGFVGKYTGLELDPEAVRFANQHFNTRVFENNDLLSYRPGQLFDVILAFEVLEHLENPALALAKIKSLFKPGGVFCATSPYPYRKNVLADKTHLYVLHPSNWQRLMDIGGFLQVKIYPMSFLPCIWRLFPKLNIRLPFFVPFKYFISTSLLVARG